MTLFNCILFLFADHIRSEVSEVLRWTVHTNQLLVDDRSLENMNNRFRPKNSFLDLWDVFQFNESFVRSEKAFDFRVIVWSTRLTQRINISFENTRFILFQIEFDLELIELLAIFSQKALKLRVYKNLKNQSSIWRLPIGDI